MLLFGLVVVDYVLLLALEIIQDANGTLRDKPWWMGREREGGREKGGREGGRERKEGRKGGDSESLILVEKAGAELVFPIWWQVSY